MGKQQAHFGFTFSCCVTKPNHPFFNLCLAQWGWWNALLLSKYMMVVC